MIRPWQPIPEQQEVALAQRYYEKTYDTDTVPATTNANGGLEFTSPVTSSNVGFFMQYKVSKRAVPTCTLYSYSTGASGQWRDSSAGADTAGTVFNIGNSSNNPAVNSTTAGHIYNAHITMDADL